MTWWIKPAPAAHSCSPLPIDAVSVKFTYSDLQDKAGYLKRKLTYKLSECPVCGNRYTYDEPKIEEIGEISYSEGHDLKARL